MDLPKYEKGYEEHNSYCTCSFEFRQEHPDSNDHEESCQCKQSSKPNSKFSLGENYG